MRSDIRSSTRELRLLCEGDGRIEGREVEVVRGSSRHRRSQLAVDVVHVVVEGT
jgi:hypothetical protein